MTEEDSILNSDIPCGENVLEKDRERVIITAASTYSGRVAYRARHRVIAEIVSDHVSSTAYELCDALTQVIDAMNPHSEDDFRLCRALMLNDEVRKLLSDIAYLRRLFDSALAKYPTETMLYQQFAIAEMQKGCCDE